ncbi:AraC family transcriptional regulator [Parabacteroides pacaensis]|uniref:AraC family transcriptional regulator n=1 Tax=Parabacteroides pacaensis TaxID=2086575 RepID=UPI000D0EC0E6|nr:AraC family transcriptional regulator [Parabacteroides pacaensis]
MYVLHEISPLAEGDCFYIIERYKTEFTYPLHCHEVFELNYVENAAGVQRIVGDSVEEIGNYDLVLITGVGLEHTWKQHNCKSIKIREITVQFSPDLFFRSFINKNQFASIHRMLEEAQNGLAFPMPAILRIYTLLDSLASEKQGFHSVIKFLSILHELSLCKEARVLSSSSFARVTTNSDSRRLTKIYNYISIHYAEEIRLSQLASIAGMTEVAFSRFFKERTGNNLTNYLIDTRLGHATRLLADTAQSVTEICYGCGFNNLSNFNRLFKKKKGCTPKEFRENYRKKKYII